MVITADNFCKIFDSSQFEQGRVDIRKKLKWNAIPTRFPHRKVSVKKARKPRRQQPENTLDSSLQLTNVLRDHTYTAVTQQEPPLSNEC